MHDVPPIRRLYRLLRRTTPTVEDFVSNASRGRPAPPAADLAILWDGLSMYATEAQARATAAAYPRRGWRAVAAVDLPDDGRFRIRKTLGPGHYTVWGEAADLLACVMEYNPL
ncbi:MAG: hypothetical protein ACR2JW_00425 [Thermomicrobiales bacterium]